MTQPTRAPAEQPVSLGGGVLVRLVAATVEVVAADYPAVADEPVVRRAVAAAARTLAGLALDDAEETAAHLPVLLGLAAPADRSHTAGGGGATAGEVRVFGYTNGVPVLARCTACDATWRRSPLDPEAAELTTWGDDHDCAPGTPRPDDAQG